MTSAVHSEFPAWSRALAPLTPAWAALLRKRRNLYRRGILRRTRLSRPVISVGNIVLGGTGKTPTVAAFAKALLDRGRRPCLLSRGYGRKSGGRVVVSRGEGALVGPELGGDEPVLLARRLPRLAVVVDSSRSSAGEFAERELRPDVFLLDDGFQHLRLARDRDVVLIAADDPFGGGALPPGGLLREPAEALADATDIVVLGDRAVEIPPELAGLAPNARITTARRRLLGPFTPSGETRPALAFGSMRLLAVSGIARPERFRTALRRAGLPVFATLSFPDHHRYSPDDVADISRVLDEERCDGVLTTGKDGVKLGPDTPFPWWWTDVSVEGDFSSILSIVDEWDVRA